MTKPIDDLDAVREISATLESVDEAARERVLRWVRERLDMPTAGAIIPQAPMFTGHAPAPTHGAGTASDIKSFVAQKDPKTDTHMAAVAAYFYRFVAPLAERKETFGAKDLTDACRKAERRRPTRPSQTMVNAYAGGLFDKEGSGVYRLNSVGENLVAMVLPGTDAAGSAGTKKAKGKSRSKRKTNASRRKGR